MPTIETRNFANHSFQKLYKSKSKRYPIMPIDEYIDKQNFGIVNEANISVLKNPCYFNTLENSFFRNNLIGYDLKGNKSILGNKINGFTSQIDGKELRDFSIFTLQNKVFPNSFG